MPDLLIVGGGLFGSQAAAYARLRGLEAIVFDAGLEGAASPAAAGLFKEAWAGKKLREHFHQALPLLDRLYGLQNVILLDEKDRAESFHFVSPTRILEAAPLRERVTAVGNGWLEAGGRHYEGWVYVAAGIWSGAFVPGLDIQGKAGAAFTFQGEREGRMVNVGPGRQAIAFVRDAGSSHFSDGTAEVHYAAEHDRQSLERAAAMGLTDPPIKRCWGIRPYTPGGPVFRQLADRTWLATGGRKMGTILGASFAKRLIEHEIGLRTG